MPLATPAGYTALDEQTVAPYLNATPELAERLGGASADWQVSEVGDGNLNLVFLVHGPQDSLCVKQSLPYVRLVGEGWPMPIERIDFEQRCLREHGRHNPGRVPEVYRYDPEMYCLVMECLSPHIIMRRGMIAATRYPQFAEQISDYLARSLFFTSDLYLPTADKKALTQIFCANTELCKITEDLIFTDPYREHERNRWTSPQLDDIAAEFRADAELKLAVSRLKMAFMGRAEALLHGDLHTGSIMITETDTRVIDHEFAFVGPMGFDIGALLANLLLNYFSQDGHASASDPREEYGEWVLGVTEQVWRLFEEKFNRLWAENGNGDGYPAALFADPAGAAALTAERRRYLARLLAASLGFAGAKMTRRVLGLAHNIDLEWIEDPDRRAACERRCLRLARELMVNADNYADVGAVTAAARALRT